MLHREHSKDLLRIWRAQLDKEVDDGDNDAYLTAYHMVEKEIAEMQQGGRDSKKIINDNNDAITTTNRITEKDYNTSRNNTNRGGSSSNSGGSSKQSRASNLTIIVAAGLRVISAVNTATSGLKITGIRIVQP